MLSCLGWLILVFRFLPSAFPGPAICFLPKERQVGSAAHLICSRSDMMVARGLNRGPGSHLLLAWNPPRENANTSAWSDCSGFGFYCLGFRAVSVEGCLEVQMMLLDILSRNSSAFHSPSHLPEHSNARSWEEKATTEVCKSQLFFLWAIVMQRAECRERNKNVKCK